MLLSNWHTEKLFDLDRSVYGQWLKNFTYPWEALPQIKAYVLTLGPTLDPNVYEQRGETIWIAKSAVVHPSASIEGPVIIGERTELRPGAYIRGSVLVGNDCVLGNSCEFKNAVLLDHVQVPHFSYVGDSILGNDAHLGAGVICSNFRQDKGPIKIHFEDGSVLDTGLRKMGVVAGDGIEVGCQAVLNPGSLLGRMSRVYPLTMTRSAVPEAHMLKADGSIVDVTLNSSETNEQTT